MEIWILEQEEEMRHESAWTMVVAAETEQEAREVAARNRMDEGEEVWLKRASCRLLRGRDYDEPILISRSDNAS